MECSIALVEEHNRRLAAAEHAAARAWEPGRPHRAREHRRGIALHFRHFAIGYAIGAVIMTLALWPYSDWLTKVVMTMHMLSALMFTIPAPVIRAALRKVAR